MKLTDEQLMDILKEAVKAIAIKYNSFTETKEEAIEETIEVKAPIQEVKKVEPKQEKPAMELAKEQDKIEEKPPTETKEPIKSVREVLDAMTYNEIKVLAKENGIKAIGNKASLIDKILEAQANEVEDNTLPTDEIEEETIEVEVPTVEDELEPIEELVEEEEEDNLYTRLVAETSDMTDEEIADLLADVGESPKGKRQALLAKLEKCVRSGVIAFDTEEEEEDNDVQEEDQEEDQEEEEIIAGTQERLAKVEELYGKYLNAYEEGEIDDKDVLTFLKDYYNGNAGYEELVAHSTKEELVEHYSLIQSNLVDDEGIEYEFGEPYIVEGEYWCSSKPMQILENGVLYDEITGEQFELED